MSIDHKQVARGAVGITIVAVGVVAVFVACSSTQSRHRDEARQQATHDESAQSPAADAEATAAKTSKPGDKNSGQVGEATQDRAGVALSRTKLNQLQTLGYMASNLPSNHYAPHPAYPPSSEEYDLSEEGGFLSPLSKPLSTFSIDVDTASYSNVRRHLKEGRLPPTGAVRIEEFLNYFSYDYPKADHDVPISILTERSHAPWAPEHELVMVGLQGVEFEAEALPPRNLTFLLDVSGSMQDPDKLELVVRAMKGLTRTLRPEDRVAIVVYAGASGLVLAPTAGDERNEILDALDRLRAGGSTNGGEGIRLAYKTARRHFDPEGINRVILASDGDFNVGVTDRDQLLRLIEEERESGVFLTVLGVGRGNLKDATMEQLADHGNGNYAYLDTIGEARKVLIRESGSTLVTVAKDVKIQVEFNPTKIAGYRLIGYDNRRLQDRDFNDDKKDAGEIGAGHSVTALYEVIPHGVGKPIVDPLRYQRPEAKSEAFEGSDELLTVKVRYKLPDEDQSRLLTRHVGDASSSIEGASQDMRFAAAVATFGMLLRDSAYGGEADWDLAARLARKALGDDPHGDRAEFLYLVSEARELTHGMGS